MDVIHTLPLDTWTPSAAPELGAVLARELEAGRLLYLPRLAFEFRAHERRFLGPSWSNGRAKNISIVGEEAPLKGAAGPPRELDELRALVARFRAQAGELIARLFPAYAAQLQLASTSYRPVRVQGRAAAGR